MKYSVYKDRVGRSIKATVTRVSDDQLDDSIAAGLVAILPWVYKIKADDLEGDGELFDFDLPSDFYRVVSVYDETSGYFIGQARMLPGTGAGGDLETNNDWIVLNTVLSFANEPAGDVKLTYGAYWDIPEADDDELDPPPWTHPLLVLRGASHVLTAEATDTANVRQWNLQVDSGNPLQNPIKEMATYYLDLFMKEMNQHPASYKGQQ